MSVSEERAKLLPNHGKRSTKWDEDEVVVTGASHTEGFSGKRTKHQVDKVQLHKAVEKLFQDTRPNGECIEAARELAKNVTSAVDELEAVSGEPMVKEMWQVEVACKDTQAAVDAAHKYIDTIDDIPWRGCREEMKSLTEKTTTYLSVDSDLKEFKSIADKLLKSLSVAEECFCALTEKCQQAVRSCNEAEAACYRKAKERRSKKKTTQIASWTIATIGAAAVIAPIAAGVTAAYAGGISAAGTVGVGIAISVIAESFDKAAKAFSNAGKKCTVVENSALRLSHAAVDVRRDLVRISEELDAALDLPLYTVISTYTLEVAYSCHRTRKLVGYCDGLP